jgi:hypothetical protein
VKPHRRVELTLPAILATTAAAAIAQAFNDVVKTEVQKKGGSDGAAEFELQSLFGVAKQCEDKNAGSAVSEAMVDGVEQSRRVGIENAVRVEGNAGRDAESWYQLNRWQSSSQIEEVDGAVSDTRGKQVTIL